MPIQKRPTVGKSKLLSVVTHLIVLYDTAVWIETLAVRKYKQIFLRVQRKLAIRICCDFRTVPTEAVLVLTDITN